METCQANVYFRPVLHVFPAVPFPFQRLFSAFPPLVQAPPVSLWTEFQSVSTLFVCSESMPKPTLPRRAFAFGSAALQHPNAMEICTNHKKTQNIYCKILEIFNSQSLWYHVIHNSAPRIPSLGMFTFLLFSLFAFRTFNSCLLPCLSTLRTLIVPCLWLFRRWRHFFGLSGILRLLRLVFAHKVSC